MRLGNITAQTLNVITNVTHKTHMIINRMTTTDTVMHDVYKVMSTEDIKKFMEVMTANTNNMNHRLNNICKLLFKQDFHNINNMRTMMTITEQLLTQVCELMLVHHYADNNGNISWSNMTKDVTNAIAESAVNAAHGLDM